ncbi:UPF0332 protein [Bacteroidia bacterium]|nr:UPF0332 protein [Bacteroidia bacterium]
MKLLEDERKALIELKLERADETIKEIPFLIEKEFYRNAANRLYYACYYVVSALLLQNSYDAHSHNGINTLFALHFVKTGIVSKEDGKLYGNLYALRQTGDYDEVKTVEREDVVTLLVPAEQFIKKIEELITNK